MTIIPAVAGSSNNASGLHPYGLSLPTTCTAALVVHQRTGSQEEKVEAILKALAGSCIRTRAADGKGVRLWVNTDGGVSWKTDRP